MGNNDNLIKQQIQKLSLQEKELKSKRSALQLEKQTESVKKKILKLDKEIQDVKQKTNEIQEKFNTSEAEINQSEAEINQILSQNRDKIKDILNLSNDLSADLSKQLGVKQLINIVDRVQTDNARRINQDKAKEYNIRLQINDIGDEILNNEKEILSGNSDGLDISQQLLDVEYIRRDILESSKDLSDEQQKKLLKELNVREKLLETQQEIIIHEKRRNELIDEGVGKIESAFESIESGLKSIPGGGMLSKVLGIETFGKDFTKTIKDNLVAGRSAFEGLGSTVSSSFKVIGSALTSTLGSVLGLVAIFAILYSVLSGITEQVMETSKELGISTGQAKKLVDNSKEWVGRLGHGLATSEEILKAQGAIVKEYGSTNNISEELTDNILTMEHAFGVAGETTAKVSKSLEGMGLSKESIATSNILAGNLAEAAGVPIDAVMEDVANSSEMIHKFLPKMGPEIYKAAVEAKRLGLTLSEIGKVGEQLLDVQSNLEKEMTAQVMLGKQIDFDKSRQLFANKEPLKAIEVLMKGIGDINDLNYYKQQAITEATGLTVDQIAEYQRKQKEINELKIKDPIAHQAYKKAIKDLEDLNKLKKQSVEEEAASNLEARRMAILWDEIKQSLIKALAPIAERLLPILKAIAWVLSGIAEQGWIIQGIFITLGTIWAGKLLLGTITKLKKLGSLAKTVFTKMISQRAAATGGSGGYSSLFNKQATPKTPTAGTGGKPSKMMQGLSKIDWKKMLAGAAAMLIVAAAVWVMAKAMQEFSTGVKWSGVAKGLVSLGALAIVVAALSFISQNIILGAVAMVIMAGGLWVLAKAMQEFSTGVEWDGIWKGLTALGAFAIVTAAMAFVAPLILIGAAAIIVMSAGLWVFAIALQAIASVDTDSIFNGLKSLADIGPGLLLAAIGIGAISLAMAAFAGGSILGLIGSVFSEIGIVRTLTKLSNLAPGLNSVAESLNSIKASMDSLDGTKADISINIPSNIEKWIEQRGPETTRSTNKAETIGTEGQKITPQTQNIPVTATTTSGTDGLDRIALLIQQLIGSVNQPQKIYIGNKVINEITRQQQLSRHQSAGFDGKYGYAIQ